MNATADNPPNPDATSRLVAVIDRPIPITELPALIDRLESEHGPGLTIGSADGVFTIRTPGRLCWCITCADEDAATYQRLTGRLANRYFIVCPDCGNKRCPRATHHDRDCSGSNEPGQPGSAYA